jgi:PAS domain S-box-containing protein
MTLFILAAAYAVTGRLGLLLAIPPGYATAIWPPSGLALAGILVWGPRVWPGIWLGSVLVNVWIAFDATTAAAALTSVAIPTSIGMGAAGQALVGAYLVRRLVGFPSPLARAQDIVIFLVLGGPLSCLVNATWAVTTLFVGGAISPEMYLFNWWTWWIGDTVGVLIVTPLVLIWTAEPRQVWRRRQLAVAAPLGLALVLAVVVFVKARAWEQATTQLHFEHRTNALAYALRRSFDGYLEVLHALQSFSTSAPTVERHAFHAFVERPLARYPGLLALEWVPRVPGTQRVAYEEAARREGYRDFQITEQDAQGQMMPAAQRPEYFPVYYLESYAGNETALGFDLASDPTRLEALRQARDTGEPAATGRVTLVQETGQHADVLVVLPIYRTGRLPTTAEERHEQLHGYVLGVFRIEDIVEAALQGMAWKDIACQLVDTTAPAAERLLYDSHPGGPLAPDPSADDRHEERRAAPSWATTIELAGRRWELWCFPTPAYLAGQQRWQAWAVPLGEFLFTGVLGAFLLLVSGRTATVEQLVIARTAELEAANRALVNEITKRTRAEAALRRARDELERRVQERTTELVCMNAALQAEILERTRLEETHAQLAAIVASSDDAIIGKTLDGRIVSWNAGAERLYGYTPEEMTGQPITTLVPPDRPNELPAILERLRRGEHMEHYETVRVRKDGTPIDVSLTVSPILDAAGHIVGASAIARDITARKQAEEAIRRLNEELEQRVRERTAQLEAANQELAAFSYSVSHDLRSPLRAIDGFVRLLLEDYAPHLDAEAQHYLHRVSANALRMSQLIDDLLTFASLSHKPLHKQPVAPGDVARQAWHALYEKREHRRVDISIEDLPSCQADPALLQQVFVNLLGNALKFTRRRELARIEVGCQEMQGERVYFVRDNGVGFAMQYVSKLFGVFHRLHRDEDYEGMGVGLALTQRIVHRHGGRIWAEAEVDKGAIFYFTL